MQKTCFLQFNSVIFFMIILFEEKPKSCKAPPFCKISFIVFIFDRFCVRDTVFARFTMGFNRFFSLSWQVLGRFWWVPIVVLTDKKYTYIYEEHSYRASNKAFFVCANLIVKVSWMLLVSRVVNVVSEVDNEKGKRFWGCCGTQDQFWIQAVDLL